MADVTVPRPHELPPYRRAMSTLRERNAVEPATRRRRASWIDPAPAFPETPPVLARHARPPRRRAVPTLATVALAGILALGGTIAATAAAAPPPAPVAAPAPAPTEAPLPTVRLAAPPPPAPIVPAPDVPAVDTAASAVEVAPCDAEPVTTALASGDDAAVIAAFGGAAPFREAVAAGGAPCIALDDPARIWVVVNKQRPFAPADFAPSGLVDVAGVRVTGGGSLQERAAGALAEMVAAAAQAGVGELALESAYRSYATQVDTYEGHVAGRGVEGADLVSARPGHSEHQSGLAADVVACGDGCGTLDDLAATPQGAWVAEHAWEYGWIVRYTDGATDVTGYVSEPWHLRFIGRELAAEYHAGGWRTLEEFFGLPPAPTYPAG